MKAGLLIYLFIVSTFAFAQVCNDFFRKALVHPNYEKVEIRLKEFYQVPKGSKKLDIISPIEYHPLIYKGSPYPPTFGELPRYRSNPDGNLPDNPYWPIEKSPRLEDDDLIGIGNDEYLSFPDTPVLDDDILKTLPEGTVFHGDGSFTLPEGSDWLPPDVLNPDKTKGRYYKTVQGQYQFIANQKFRARRIEREIAKKANLSLKDYVALNHNFHGAMATDGSTGLFKYNGSFYINTETNLIKAYKKAMQTDFSTFSVDDLLNIRRTCIEEISIQGKGGSRLVKPKLEFKSNGSGAKITLQEGDKIPDEVMDKFKKYGFEVTSSEKEVKLKYNWGERGPPLEEYTQEIQRLINEGHSPEYIVSYAIQELLIMHPFKGGNGRTARIIGQALYKKLTGKTIAFPRAFKNELFNTHHDLTKKLFFQKTEREYFFSHFSGSNFKDPILSKPDLTPPKLSSKTEEGIIKKYSKQTSDEFSGEDPFTPYPGYPGPGVDFVPDPLGFHVNIIDFKADLIKNYPELKIITTKLPLAKNTEPIVDVAFKDFILNGKTYKFNKQKAFVRKSPGELLFFGDSKKDMKNAEEVVKLFFNYGRKSRGKVTRDIGQHQGTVKNELGQYSGFFSTSIDYKVAKSFADIGGNRVGIVYLINPKDADVLYINGFQYSNKLSPMFFSETEFVFSEVLAPNRVYGAILLEKGKPVKLMTNPNYDIP